MLFLMFGAIIFGVVAYNIARKQGSGSPLAWGFFAIILFPFSVSLTTQPPESSKPKGFEMDTRSGSFTVNGFSYHRSAVREVQWHPVHYIRFRSIFADFDAHVERLKMLLCG